MSGFSEALIIFGKVIAVIGAVCCFYAAIWMYDDKQGRVQNKLEEWWIEFHDRQKRALSAATVLMRGIASFANSCLDVTFGHRLISLRAIIVSAHLSVASLFLSLAAFLGTIQVVMGDYVGSPLSSIFEAAASVALATASIGLAVLSTRSIRGRLTSMFGFAALLALILYLSELNASFLALSLLLGMVLGLVSDIAFVAVTRLLLRWCERLEGATWCLIVLSVNTVLGLVLWVAPILLLFSGSLDEHRDLRLLNSEALVFNSLDGFISLFLLLIASFLLLHRFLWPFAARTLYAIAPTPARKALLIVVGLFLLKVGFGEIPEDVRRVIEAFKG